MNARWHGPAVLFIAGIVVVITLIALPILLQEQTRDWIAYQQAADRLRASGPLYEWELATPQDEYYLYPPGMAAAWAAFGSAPLLLTLKVVALLAVGVLAPMVVDRPGRTWMAAALIGGGSLLWAPNLYDLVLGNVMALWVGALAVSITRRGWSGAISLGVVMALAAKPAILPYAIWLTLRRPGDALRTLVVALAASALVAIAVGPSRYLEYLEALPRMTMLAADFTGNVGLVTVSPGLAIAGVAGSWILAALAALRLDERRGAAAVLASMLLAQPTIGFNYAGLLFPALVLLWGADRVIGTVAFGIVTPLLLVSPVLAAVVVIMLAVISALRVRSRAVRLATP